MNNVIVVHCLAGKGRTGTVICCYLIYSGRFSTPEEALKYYSQKRFGTDDLGVTQPSQVRYILYFYQIFKEKFLSPTVKYIDSIILNGVPNFNANGSCKPIIEFISVKNDQKVLQ